MCAKMSKFVENCRKIIQKLQKLLTFREISESGDTIFSFRMNNSIQSLVTKLLTEGGKVVGVEYDQGTSAFTSAEK